MPPDPALVEYAQRVAGYVEGHDIFYRDDGEEALIVGHVDAAPTEILSVMMGRRVQRGIVAPYAWEDWEAPTAP